MCLRCKPTSRQALRHRRLLPAKPAHTEGLESTSAASLPPQLWPVFSSFPNKDQTSLSFYYSNLNNVFLFSLIFFQVKNPFLALTSDLIFQAFAVFWNFPLIWSGCLSRWHFPLLSQHSSIAVLCLPLLSWGLHVWWGGGWQETGAWHVRSVCPGHASLGNGSSHTPLLFYISFPMKIFLPCLFHKAC